MSARTVGIIAVVGMVMLSKLHAQGGRDPTQAPTEAGLVAPHAAGLAAATSAPNYSVIVQDGQARLVVGTRLVAPGGMVGDSRLERITETEVWLRKGKELRKVPRFAGIQRTNNVTASPATSASCPPASAASSKVRRAASKPSSSAGADPLGCAAVQP